jgi:signal transduction histidine kinase
VVRDDVVQRCVTVARNITTRKLAEERLQAANLQALSLAKALQAEKALLSGVLESLPHPVYLKDTELRYSLVNTAFLRIRGLSDLDAVLGHEEEHLPVRDALSEVLLPVEGEVLRTGTAVTDLRVTLPGRHGSATVLLLSVLPHRIPGPAGGETLGVIGVAADVTHVTELERQLAQGSRLEAIGQLAAGIAHEINTPIQFVSDNTRFINDSFDSLLPAVRAAAGLAEQAELTGEEVRAGLARLLGELDLDFLIEEVPAALSQSLEGLDRVTDIVRAMKDFSHPGRERIDADLNRAVESTVQVSRSEWKYVAELDLRLDPDVGLVPCYEGELKQVLLNVIINAAQALAEQREAEPGLGAGHIRVSTRRHGERIEIEIADDGTGMPEDVRQRVFDQFFTTKDVGKGTGQGLSIAYNVVVQKHRGSMEVHSAPGQGATFMITLPARVEEATVQP